MLKLTEDVQAVAKKRGYLCGLDGRHLHIRAVYAALNTLLQSAGALVMKQANVIFWDWMKRQDGGLDVHQMAHIHDEFQLAVNNKYDPCWIGGFAVNSIRNAGTAFNLHCELDGEWKKGMNWAECH